jgi:hypothetical protein
MGEIGGKIFNEIENSKVKEGKEITWRQNKTEEEENGRNRRKDI